MSKHKVKSHFWNNGILKTMEHWFESLEEAILHADNSDAHTSKIYGPAGELLSTKTATLVPEQMSSRETYA